MRRWPSILAHTAILGLVTTLPASQVSFINIDGAIGPATAGYIARSIKLAAARNDECLIIQLDTPGGLLESTKHIVRSFYDSPVPTVVYVAPAGAIAGSAGTFITMAADVAAMAPHTSIGAAHPVAIGSSGEVEKSDDTMKKKMENAAASFIETSRRSATAMSSGRAKPSWKARSSKRTRHSNSPSLTLSRMICLICSSNSMGGKRAEKHCEPGRPPWRRFP